MENIPKQSPDLSSIPGIRKYTSQEALLADDTWAYQHLLLKAWKELQLTTVLAINGLPTVYVRDSQTPLQPSEIAELHRKFWNQGLATVFLLLDPNRIRVFSAMVAPIDPISASESDIDERLLVEAIDNATQATQDSLVLKIATGQYYASNSGRFNPEQAIDSYLLNNLQAVRDELVHGDNGLDSVEAHAFLGRILFVCYLCHRKIISLSTYFRGRNWSDIREMLADFDDKQEAHSALYGTLFPKLRQEFNGSMFDDDLNDERKNVRPDHLEAIQRFLNGDNIHAGQPSLGLWAYDFGFIPIELISSIYEKFLSAESNNKQRQQGAYYTPRFLAEMTLDVALEKRQSLEGLQFLDPACGSGIFLVLMFNRLVAEWRSRQTTEFTVTDQADALRARLVQLHGVDVNATACRISCFSLYLAYLDQFDPPDVRKHMAQTGYKLPHLLHSDKSRVKTLPVVWQKDFFGIADQWHGKFDVIVGNLPWGEYGTQQIAQPFLEKIPRLLAYQGSASLITPSKILFNKTSENFQVKWLSQVTLEKVVQLADYRRILFNEAKSPATIIRFTNISAQIDHDIEYVTPKVTRTDLRDGVIVVSPQDRKWIKQAHLLRATKKGTMGDIWKMKFWGTPRDQKLLDYLLTFPKLEDLTGTPTQFKNKAKRWCKGVGFEALRSYSKATARPMTYSANDRFITANEIKGLVFVPQELTTELGKYLKIKGYVTNKLRCAPDDQIFTPPLVLINKGFTSCAFIDYPVRFQDALRSISGPNKDTPYLMFLSAFLRSKLARYFIFHTAASLGTERDQVHLEEALQLPFFLPDHEDALPNSQQRMEEVIKYFTTLKTETEKSLVDSQKNILTNALSEERIHSEWRKELVARTQQVQSKIDPLIYQYFGLTDQDIALVEDTCNIFDQSDTPASLFTAQQIKTLQVVDVNGMSHYATMLTDTLNSWVSGTLRVSATGSVDPLTGLGLLELRQASKAVPYSTRSTSTELATSIHRLQQVARQQAGSLEYHRSGWYFDNKRIIIVKPARLGEWTRTAALNDAAEIYAHIAQARQFQHL